jgi:hypothetical protein
MAGTSRTGSERAKSFSATPGRSLVILMRPDCRLTVNSRLPEAGCRQPACGSGGDGETFSPQRSGAEVPFGKFGRGVGHSSVWGRFASDLLQWRTAASRGRSSALAAKDNSLLSRVSFRIVAIMFAAKPHAPFPNLMSVVITFSSS